VMKRTHQLLLIATFVPLCWLLMQAVHELGHVVAVVATGGAVERVVLHPLTISRTDTSGSSHPLFVFGHAVGRQLAAPRVARSVKAIESHLAQLSLDSSGQSVIPQDRP
jgi:hypothetical protein